MASPTPPDDDEYQFDPAEPFKGIIVCCTSIPPEQRTVVAQRVADLGGVHKYDLTPDVTHLVVGDYDTPKYRHVARERPDIKAMDAAWIERVAELWKNDDEIDFRKLEKEYQLKALERRGAIPALDGSRSVKDSLIICLTGFGDQREQIAEKITANGGRYTGDLTRRCTHLVVNKPEGKKYKAAKDWSIQTVTLAWLEQTIARGMILEEARFDPMLPPDEQGEGAWIKRDLRRDSLGKRSRSMALAAEGGPRKLRKTASMKLSSQRNSIWGDIMGMGATSRQNSFAKEQPNAVEAPQAQQADILPPPAPQGVFANCYFFIHGFNEQRAGILEQTILSLEGSLCGSINDVSTRPLPEETSQRFLIVPQSSQPDTHPEVDCERVNVVTEYYIEKCLHYKQFVGPNDHVLGRPFPFFPIPGFANLTICSATFSGIELNQVARSVVQLGARFEEEFRRETDVIVCKKLTTIRKEKLKMALKWGVPVVSADWLWSCIASGFKAPFNDFIFPELANRYPRVKGETSFASASVSTSLGRSISEAPSKPSRAAPARAALDTTAFEPEKPHPHKDTSHQDSTVSAEFTTARTHPAESFAREFDAPLTEISSAKLNKSPSPTKQTEILPRSKSDPTSKATSTRLPAPPQADSQPLPTTEENPPTAQHLEDERRSQAKAAERQALTSKLTSLIAPPATALPPPNPAPRRRQILGRAISNASSAASADTAVLARPADEEADEDAPQQQPPAATQLEYRDPEALEVKAALMSRMMGEVRPASSSSSSKGVDWGVGGGRTMRKR